MSLLGIAQFLLEHYVSYNHFPKIPPFADVLGGWDQSSSFYYLFFSVSHHITAENKVYGIILSRMYVLPPRTRLSRVTTVPVWTLVSEKCGLPSNPVCYHSTKMSTGHLFLKGLALLYFLMFFFYDAGKRKDEACSLHFLALLSAVSSWENLAGNTELAYFFCCIYRTKKWEKKRRRDVRAESSTTKELSRIWRSDRMRSKRNVYVLRRDERAHGLLCQ